MSLPTSPLTEPRLVAAVQSGLASRSKPSSVFPSQSSSVPPHTSLLLAVVSEHTSELLGHDHEPSSHSSESVPSQATPSIGSSLPSPDAESQSSSAPLQTSSTELASSLQIVLSAPLQRTVPSRQ